MASQCNICRNALIGFLNIPMSRQNKRFAWRQIDEEKTGHMKMSLKL
jgi:hypothetical protein